VWRIYSFLFFWEVRWSAEQVRCNLVFCIQLCLVHKVKVSKEVKATLTVTLTVTHGVEAVLRLTNRIFVCI